MYAECKRVANHRFAHSFPFTITKFHFVFFSWLLFTQHSQYTGQASIESWCETTAMKIKTCTKQKHKSSNDVCCLLFAYAKSEWIDWCESEIKIKQSKRKYTTAWRAAKALEQKPFVIALNRWCVGCFFRSFIFFFGSLRSDCWSWSTREQWTNNNYKNKRIVSMTRDD